MSRTLLPEEEKELLQEVLLSPGWRVLLNKVLNERLTYHTKQIFSSARNANGESAALNVGKYDGAIDLIEFTYTAANYELPEHFKNVKRNI